MVMRVVAVAGALGVAGACVGNASGIGVVLTVALPVYLAGLGCPRRSTNVLKHAAAGQAAVRHAHDGPWLRWGHRRRRRFRRPDTRLTGLRDRVDAAGGALRVLSAPGRGTTIQAWLPARPATDD
jgi:hypothetical protein